MNAKTKLAIGLGLLDITRQVAHAWAAKRQEQEHRAAVTTLLGKGFKKDARVLAQSMRDRMTDRPLDVLPWRHHEPTFAERARPWAPIAAVVAAATAIVVFTARWIAHNEPDADAETITTDSKMIGAVRAGSSAIDAGVSKVVDGSAAAAVGTAAAVAGGSTAVRDTAVQKVKDEIDERVVTPVKKKAVFYGSVGIVGLTVYIIVIAVVVQLLVSAIG